METEKGKIGNVIQEIKKKESNHKEIVEILRDRGYTAKEVYRSLIDAGFENIKLGDIIPPYVCVILEEVIHFTV